MEKEDEDFFGKTLKYALAGVLLLVFLIIGGCPAACVGTTERGVMTVFGAVKGEETLMPGVHFKIPVVGKIKTRSITPNETKINIQLNRNAAVSLDTQEIGVNASVFWKYDDNKIPLIIRNYQKADIDTILSNQATEALKTVIGQYTVFDLGKNTSVIASAALAALNARVTLPVVLVELTLSDFDWSEEVDKIVTQKITAMASVDKARADADRAEQEQRRISIEAEAQARAAIAKAEGELKAAQLMADAKRAEGQGIADYNRSISANLAQELEFRRLEIQLERARKWNGNEIPTYLPLSPNGGVVTLPAR
jgi:regulator of protease activity HflC (stomatin/prohibitin superfamily)